ncbi:MAG: hypothetical protein WCA32_23200 [Chromatiaceae bacterium]
MRILFDQGTPAPLRALLPDHEVVTAYEQGWSTLDDRQLLRSAMEQGFEVLVTTDRSLKHQQNLASCSLGVVVLGTTSWPRIKASADSIAVALTHAVPGETIEVSIP